MKASLLFLLTMLVGVLLMEAGVRALNMHDPLIWAPDPVFGWKPIPEAKRLYTLEGRGLVEINTHGYRDRQRDISKAESTIRIGVFGDSQTEAVQVDLEETYHHQLQEMFKGGNTQVEVFNFGVTGYSPTQIWLTMQSEVERYDLDIVVVALFLDNDVSGSVPELSVSTTGTPFIVPNTDPLEIDFEPAEQSHRDFFSEPKHTIRHYSGLYRFIFRLKDSLTRCGENCQSKPIPTRYELYLEQPDAIWQTAWDTFEQTLLEIIKLTKSLDKELIFLSIPAGQTINQAAWDNILNANPAMKTRKWELAGAEERLTRFAEQHAIPLIQPYEHFKEISRDASLHFGNVDHLTAAGHEEIARQAFPALQGIVELLQQEQ